MAINKVISAVVFALSAVLLQHQTTQVDAQCVCLAVYYPPSYYAERGAVVLRAKILSRSPESDVNDDVTYKVRPTTIYAGEPDVEYGKSISFITPASTNDCGVDLKIRGDYLLSLFRTTSSTSDSDQGGKLTLHACDLNKLWRDVFDEEKEDLARLLEGSDDDYE